MRVSSDRSTTEVSRPVQLISLTVVFGLLAGAAISLLAFYLARYGPSGDSWSFRGNGALAAYTAIRAVLAAGWTAFVLRYRGRRAWLAFGLGAGLVGLVLASIGAALLPVFGSAADQALGGVVLVLLAAWTLIAPALATMIPRAGEGPRSNITGNGGAAAAWLAATVAGLVAVGLALPAGS